MTSLKMCRWSLMALLGLGGLTAGTAIPHTPQVENAVDGSRLSETSWLKCACSRLDGTGSNTTWPRQQPGGVPEGNGRGS